MTLTDTEKEIIKIIEDIPADRWKLYSDAIADYKMHTDWNAVFVCVRLIEENKLQLIVSNSATMMDKIDIFISKKESTGLFQFYNKLIENHKQELTKNILQKLQRTTIS